MILKTAFCRIMEKIIGMKLQYSQFSSDVVVFNRILYFWNSLYVQKWLHSKSTSKEEVKLMIYDLIYRRIDELDRDISTAVIFQVINSRVYILPFIILTAIFSIFHSVPNSDELLFFVLSFNPLKRFTIGASTF